ncbi:MAG: hypothetical protein MUE63_04680 [Xanthomonadales bacterium]|jgi:hypothetical protein|nr:hypothetical protein [Xanthomonadales bacterium]
MEIVYFIAFIVACAFLVIWSTGKSKKETELAQKRKAKVKKSRAELLETPADYTLSRPDQLWFTRKSASALGVTPTNLFAPKSQAPEPEYDGYSRRDRHHVADPTATIKQDARVGEPGIGSGEYKGGNLAR